MNIDPASELTEEQVAALQTKLLNTRGELIRRAREQLAAEQARRPEGEPAGDAADLSGISFEQGMFAGRAAADHQRLKEIDAALERIEQGSYGVCAGTGEAIGFQRLSVEPWARYSTEYQEELERESGRRGSPTL